VQAVGRSITILSVPEHDGFKRHLDDAGAGHASQLETQHMSRDGSRLEVEMTLSPIRDGAGVVIGAACAAQDVTERKQAERELARLALAAQYGADAIISVDLGGYVRHWNQGAERLYGWSASDAIGRALDQLTGSIEQLHDALRAGDASHQSEVTRRCKDGSIVDVLTSSCPWQVDGSVIGTTIVAIDISERKRAERELARLADAAEHGADAVISVDLDGSVRHWNRGAEQVYGFTAQEAVGTDLRELTMVTDELDEDIARVIAGESGYQYEAQCRCKDGSLVDVLTTVTPWRADGQLIGLTAVTIDITDRKRAEQASGRLAAIVESSDDAIIGKTLDGEVISWNAAAERIYGYTAAEAIGRHISIVVPSGQPDEERLLQRDVAAGGRITHCETLRRRKDGALIDVSLTVSPIKDRSARVIGASSVARDITDHKQAERAREQALADLEEAQRIAHVGSWSWDAITDQLSWSAQTYAIYGRDRTLAPPSGNDALKYVHPVDRARIACGLASAYAGEAAFEHDYQIIAGDGARRTVHILGHADPARPGCYMGTVQDVTEQRRAEAELRRSEARQRTILEAAPVGIALADATSPFTLLQANSALSEMLGIEAAQLTGRGALTLVDQRHRAAAQEQLQRLLVGEERYVSTEVEIMAKRSEALWVNVIGAVVAGADGRPEHLVLQLQDITERRRFENELRFYAERDPLTGLLNRRRFEEELDRAVAANDRYSTPATLLVCDLDNLKLVNDTLGHKAGDELIKSVARGLSHALRRNDVLARMGGDEFAVMMPHTGLQKAKATAERLRAAALNLNLIVSGHKLHTTLSIGVAPIGDGLSAEDSLVAADLAMYEAKRTGRNRVATSRHAFTDEAMTKHLGWLGRLREALAEDRFELHAQPIADLKTGRSHHFELLLRMREPDGELLLPAAFIPTAERFGVIADIDRWVVRNAIRLLAEDRHSDVVYAVNLSGVSVGDPELLCLIDREITGRAVDPARLMFEFTETAAIADLGASREFTQGLARIGCASALDDFGSGFGSFSYLKHLPVDYLKIDGDFIRDLPGSSEDRILVKAIVDVARGLHKQTIAQFVSSQSALELLRDYGVDYAQGFHLGGPEPLLTAIQQARVA
jgi:diguanylate cyclase (GGDEF)-like protein/PAS domain S-box-containing protein